MTPLISADKFDISNSSLTEMNAAHLSLVHERVEPHLVLKIDGEDEIGQPMPSALWVHSADSAAIVNGNRSGVGVPRATRNSERGASLHHNGLEALLFAATSH